MAWSPWFALWIVNDALNKGARREALAASGGLPRGRPS